MNFRKRLSRLAAARVEDGTTETEKNNEEANQIESSGVSAPDDAQTSSLQTGARELQELREKLGQDLDLSPKQRAEPPDSTSQLQAGSYQFEWREGPGGPFRSHRRIFHRDALHGLLPFSLAEEADMSLLSLLAKTPDLVSCEPQRALYFDTETTGLGGAGTLAFLLGCLWLNEEDQWVVEEIFLNEPHEEAAALDYFAERVRQASFLVSYNGKSFDLPLLNSRRVMQRQPALEKKPHLDLLHLVRRLHRSRLTSFRLPHLEREILDFHRPSTDIPGAEIAPLYFHYLRSKDIRPLSAVFEHNEWDLLSMAGLCGFYGEPLRTWFLQDRLNAEELVAAAKLLSQQKNHELAIPLLAVAGADTGTASASMARAFVHKARGDKSLALLDFKNSLESLSASSEQQKVTKTGRLELAKLYEHHIKDYAQALEVISQGTIEGQGAHEHREARLQRKDLKKRENR